LKKIRPFILTAFIFLSIIEIGETKAQQIEPIPSNFKEYLPMFIDYYQNNNAYISFFVFGNVGFYTATKQGAYCYMEKAQENAFPWCITNENGTPCQQLDANIQNNFFNLSPKGDFCEGYPGISSGYYFNSIKVNDLPTFIIGFNDEGEPKKGVINIPKELINAPIMKVTAILNEKHSCYLYFISIEENWYFLCQDFCDCSA
jgi:hypothetical protein